MFSKLLIRKQQPLRNIDQTSTTLQNYARESPSPFLFDKLNEESMTACLTATRIPIGCEYCFQAQGFDHEADQLSNSKPSIERKVCN